MLIVLMTSLSSCGVSSQTRPSLKEKLGQYTWIVPSKYLTCALSDEATSEIWVYVSQVLPEPLAEKCYSSQKAKYVITLTKLGAPPLAIATSPIDVLPESIPIKNVKAAPIFKQIGSREPFVAMEMGMGYVNYPGHVSEIYQDNKPTHVFYKCISEPDICSIFFQSYGVILNIQWGESSPPPPYYMLRIAKAVNLTLATWKH